MKTPSLVLQRRWFLVVVLCLSAALGPMALMSRPAHAQFPYDEILADLQQARQVMAERLAYCNSFPFEHDHDRAALDAAYASSAQQNLQQAYGLISATHRDILDEGARRAGYTFPQLVQGATTITDMIRMLDILISAIQQNLAGVKAPTSTAQTNQEKLDAAIKARDIQGILEAMKGTTTGAIPDTEAKQQYELGQKEIARINQENLNAAIKARDIQGILEAMKWAMGGAVSVDNASVQEKQAMKALSDLNWDPLKTTTPPQTTKPATTTPPPGRISFEPPAQGGEVFVKEAGSDWKPISPAGQVMPVSEDFAVRTSQGTVLITDLPGQGDQVVVGENTEFQIKEQGVLDLLFGQIRSKIVKFRQKFEVRTGQGTGSIRGTDFIVDATPERTDVLVFEGTVELSDLERHRTVLVKVGEHSMVAVGGLPTEPQRFDNTTVFQKYKSLFKSEEEIKAVLVNMEKLAKGGEAAGFPIYLLVIPVIVIAVVIGLVMRRMRRA